MKNEDNMFKYFLYAPQAELDPVYVTISGCKYGWGWFQNTLPIYHRYSIFSLTFDSKLYRSFNNAPVEIGLKGKRIWKERFAAFFAILA